MLSLLINCYCICYFSLLLLLSLLQCPVIGWARVKTLHCCQISCIIGCCCNTTPSLPSPQPKEEEDQPFWDKFKTLLLENLIKRLWIKYRLSHKLQTKFRAAHQSLIVLTKLVDITHRPHNDTSKKKTNKKTPVLWATSRGLLLCNIDINSSNTKHKFKNIQSHKDLFTHTHTHCGTRAKWPTKKLLCHIQ